MNEPCKVCSKETPIIRKRPMVGYNRTILCPSCIRVVNLLSRVSAGLLPPIDAAAAIRAEILEGG